jgi:hypothetical protein
LNAAGWDVEVSKMVSAFGAQIDKSDATAISDYLNRNYGPTPPPIPPSPKSPRSGERPFPTTLTEITDQHRPPESEEPALRRPKVTAFFRHYCRTVRTSAAARLQKASNQLFSPPERTENLDTDALAPLALAPQFRAVHTAAGLRGSYSRSGNCERPE